MQTFLQSNLNSVTEEHEQILQFLKESKKQTAEVKMSIEQLGQYKELSVWVRSKSKGFY